MDRSTLWLINVEMQLERVDCLLVLSIAVLVSYKIMKWIYESRAWYRHKWEYNIKMDLREMGWDEMWWVE